MASNLPEPVDRLLTTPSPRGWVDTLASFIRRPGAARGWGSGKRAAEPPVSALSQDMGLLFSSNQYTELAALLWGFLKGEVGLIWYGHPGK